MLGYKPESAKHKSLFADVLSATPGVVLPAAYDARDTRAHESPCVAFQPKNQGSCGSCYAFGTTSAFATRLCLSSKRAVNFDLSFQEVMDCNTGCNGGTSSDVYNTMYTKPTVPVTCDSYSAVFDPKSCGVHSCQKPLQVFAEKDSYRVYKGVPAMQEELLVNGPGPVAYTVYDDFAAYRYVKFKPHGVTFIVLLLSPSPLTPPTAVEFTPNPAAPKRRARTWLCSSAGAKKPTALSTGSCKIRGATLGVTAVSSR
jgi:cathepsin B